MKANVHTTPAPTIFPTLEALLEMNACLKSEQGSCKDGDNGDDLGE